MLTKRISGLTLMAIVSTSSQGGIALDAVDRGNYGGAGGHVPANLSYLVGDQFRNFFVYDLAPIDAEIVTAELRIFLNFYNSADPFETWSLYDVTTPIDDLLSGDASVDGYVDLGTGVEFGEITVNQGTKFEFLTITLNSDAIASLNAARVANDTRWAIGGALTTLDPDVMIPENLFPVSNTVPLSDTQLIVTTIPAPPAVALLGLAMIAPIKRRRRRVQ